MLHLGNLPIIVSPCLLFLLSSKINKNCLFPTIVANVENLASISSFKVIIP